MYKVNIPFSKIVIFALHCFCRFSSKKYISTHQWIYLLVCLPTHRWIYLLSCLPTHRWIIEVAFFIIIIFFIVSLSYSRRCVWFISSFGGLNTGDVIRDVLFWSFLKDHKYLQTNTITHRLKIFIFFYIQTQKHTQNTYLLSQVQCLEEKLL